MLQRAAAATSEVWALGLHTRRRGFEHAREVRFLQLAAPLAQRDLYAFSGQRVGDEDAPAVDVGHAHAVMREVDDRGDRRGAVIFHAARSARARGTAADAGARIA